MDVFITCNFYHFSENNFVRKASLSDSFYLKEQTAKNEVLDYVKYFEEKGDFTSVSLYNKPIIDFDSVVLGSYVDSSSRPQYFGYVKCYVVER